jgi:hypothetical protein
MERDESTDFTRAFLSYICSSPLDGYLTETLCVWQFPLRHSAVPRELDDAGVIVAYPETRFGSLAF